ncbi:hypothetical protein D9M68_616180 [compost metagenome]
MAREYALGAVGDANIRSLAVGLREGEVRTGLGEPGGHLLGGANRRGGFENDQVAFPQHGRDGFAGRFDIAQVGLVVFLEWRRHGKQEGISRLGDGCGTQVAFDYGGMHDHIQVGLDDMNFTTVDGIDGVLVHIDADDFLLARGEDGCGGQANVAQANYRDRLVRHFASFLRPKFRVETMSPGAWVEA